MKKIPRIQLFFRLFGEAAGFNQICSLSNAKAIFPRSAFFGSVMSSRQEQLIQNQRFAYVAEAKPP